MKPRNIYARDRLKTEPKGKSRTKQSFVKESDINTIVSKYRRTGALTHYAKHAPQYGDFTGVEYKTAMDLVTEANTMFAELPGQLRQSFNNSPEAFFDFVNDPANSEALEEMGLREPRGPREERAVANNLPDSAEPEPEPEPQPEG